MRDWNAIVRERMKSLGVAPAKQEEIIAELAGHLEDCFDERCEQGLCETEAVERALEEVADWHALARKIRRAKREESGMNSRTRQLWLPGLVSLTAANLLLMALSYTSLQPQLVTERSTAWFPGLALMAAYLPWVALQPLVGALGAWLSHRAGGGRAMRLCAALFPSIVMLACWGLFIPASAAVERNVSVLRHPIYLALGALVWVAPAMTGLLFGALPFLAAPKLQES